MKKYTYKNAGQPCALPSCKKTCVFYKYKFAFKKQEKPLKIGYKFIKN